MVFNMLTNYFTAITQNVLLLLVTAKNSQLCGSGSASGDLDVFFFASC